VKNIKRKSVDIYNKQYGTQNYCSTERYPHSIITFPKDTQKSSLHPTQKPVALMEYLIKTYTNENELVLDFTAGSGTSGVACKNLNRNFIGIELDEKYFNIAKDRIDDGKTIAKQIDELAELTVEFYDRLNKREGR